MTTRKPDHEPIREVDHAALERRIGTPGYIRLFEMIRDRIATKDAAEDAAGGEQEQRGVTDAI